jgi:hypothetical protein
MYFCNAYMGDCYTPTGYFAEECPSNEVEVCKIENVQVCKPGRSFKVKDAIVPAITNFSRRPKRT